MFYKYLNKKCNVSTKTAIKAVLKQKKIYIFK